MSEHELREVCSCGEEIGEGESFQDHLDEEIGEQIRQAVQRANPGWDIHEINVRGHATSHHLDLKRDGIAKVGIGLIRELRAEGFFPSGWYYEPNSADDNVMRIYLRKEGEL